MKSKKFTGFLLLSVVLLLAACGKKEPAYLRYIPKDASSIMAFDVKGMMEKMEKDSLPVEKLLELLKDSTGEYSEPVAMWGKLKNAGIDLDHRVMVAIPAVDMNNKSVDIEVVAGLDDRKKLESFVSSLPESPKVITEGDISYAYAHNWLIGWNKEAVMLVGGNQARAGMNHVDSLADAPTAIPVPGVDVSRLDKLKKYFSLEKDVSIASHDGFTTLLDEPGDIAIFSNTSSLLSNAKLAGAIANMPKIKALLDGIYSTSIVNFEADKVTISSNTFVGPTMADLLEKYGVRKIDMNLVESFPGNNIAGIAAFSFNPEIINALLQEVGAEALVNLPLSQLGLTAEDITKAFKGDFALVFGDFVVKTLTRTNAENEPFVSKEPTGKLLMAVRIGDKASFDKLLGLALQTGMLVQQGNRLILSEKVTQNAGQEMFLGIEKDLLLFSTDEVLYNNYLTQTTKSSLPAPAKAALKGSSMAFYGDFQQLFSGIPDSAFDAKNVHERRVFDQAAATFQNASFHSTGFDGKKMHGEGVLNLAGDRNSLPQLARFALFLASEEKARKAEQQEAIIEEQAKIDSTLVGPVH